MAGVNLPVPVAAAGAGMCLLAGYLLGVVAGPDTPALTTATVASYDEGTSQLCLSGEAASHARGAGPNGQLCGTWRRIPGGTVPRPGDAFRFVSTTSAPSGDGSPTLVLIYGDVVP